MFHISQTSTAPVDRRRFLARMWAVAALAVVAAAMTQSLVTHASDDNAQFIAELHAAMQTMMAAMDATPTGDVDTDFAAMMIPHHPAAIEMARAELRSGRNEQLRRLAQEIIVTQQQEIAVMRLALGQPARSEAPVQGSSASSDGRGANQATKASSTRSAIATAYMPRNSSPIPFQSRIPPITGCSASFGWAIRCPGT